EMANTRLSAGDAGARKASGRANAPARSRRPATLREIKFARQKGTRLEPIERILQALQAKPIRNKKAAGTKYCQQPDCYVERQTLLCLWVDAADGGGVGDALDADQMGGQAHVHVLLFRHLSDGVVGAHHDRLHLDIDLVLLPEEELQILHPF